MVKIGDAVTFVDPYAVVHPALVTQLWPGMNLAANQPGVNLLIVSPDEDKADQYGRQIVRHTSVVHQSAQPAHGNFWKE